MRLLDGHIGGGRGAVSVNIVIDLVFRPSRHPPHRIHHPDRHDRLKLWLLIPAAADPRQWLRKWRLV